MFRFDRPCYKCRSYTCDLSCKEPEQEPVAWRYDEATYRPDDLRGRQWRFTLFSTRKPYADEMVQNVTPLYTAPPQRKPLTDEIEKIINDNADSDGMCAADDLLAAIRSHGIGGEE